MRLFKTLLLLMICNICYGQSDTCLTEHLDSATFFSQPWIGNNQMLLNELDSIENIMRSGDAIARMDGSVIGGANPNMYQIPVVIKNFYDLSNPKIPDAEIERYLNYVNKLYQHNGLYIRLYLRNIMNVLDSDKNDIGGDIEANKVMKHEYQDNILNIAFVRKFDGASGIAHKPQDPLLKKYTCVVRSVFPRVYFENANTLAHEVGHCLGLVHTHDKSNFINDKCHQEPVSRTQKAPLWCFNLFHIGKPLCEYRGDGLCDTDGDPDLGAGNLYEYYGCDYYDYLSTPIPPLKYDAWGSPWLQAPGDNALRNLMGYNNQKHFCRKELTPMQKAIMYKGTRKHGPAFNQDNEWYFYTNQDVDVFENDNYWKADNANNDKFSHSYYNSSFESSFNGNNRIDLNTQQYHTFHQLPNNDGSYYAGDIDWVYFQNNTGGTKSFIIQTLVVDGEFVPDTKITLYNVNASTGALGSQIATHDDNSSSDKFSKITRNLAVGYYAIRIENKITDVSQDGSKGHYYIRVDACYDKTQTKVTGANSICGSSQTYTVSNIPAGATVTWFHPGVDLILTPSGNSCIVASRGRGDVKLYAVVSFCGMLDTFVKTIAINMPQYVYFASESYRTAYPNTEDDFGLNMQCYKNIGGGIDYTAHYENYSSITWTKMSSYPAATSALWSSNVGGDPRKINVHLRVANASLTLKADVTNACGTISNTYTFLSNGITCSTAMMRGVSEPTEVDYYDAYMSYQTLIITYKDEEENKSELMKVIISDKMGNIILEKTDVSIKEDQIQIDMSAYKSDNYYVILQYADGNIEPQQVAKF